MPKVKKGQADNLADQILGEVGRAEKILIFIGYLMYGWFFMIMAFVFGSLIWYNLEYVSKFLALFVPIASVVGWLCNTRRGD